MATSNKPYLGNKTILNKAGGCFVPRNDDSCLQSDYLLYNFFYVYQFAFCIHALDIYTEFFGYIAIKKNELHGLVFFYRLTRKGSSIKWYAHPGHIFYLVQFRSWGNRTLS